MKRKIATKDLVLTALFAALTAVLAQIQLPIGPVPFNLAVFGAFLAGMLLAPAWAAASMGVYMLLGAVGIPVFAGFMGGPAVLLGKTGGYVIGYIFIALATALAVKRSGKLPVIGAAMLAGLLICYGFGTAWFMAVTGADLVSALGWCVLPFIVPDVCKGVSFFSSFNSSCSFFSSWRSFFSIASRSSSSSISICKKHRIKSPQEIQMVR